MRIEFFAEPIDYDGSQLVPHWIYRRFGALDDALVGFVGRADVPISHMVDLEDVSSASPIFSPRMLHFVGEWFFDSLELGIAYQRLFICRAAESLRARGIAVERRGDDLFVAEKKLSVSIATKSPLSVLMHTGFNVRTEGTPVPTSGLEELGIDVETFARELLEGFRDELRDLRKARVKVLPR